MIPNRVTSILVNSIHFSTMMYSFSKKKINTIFYLLYFISQWWLILKKISLTKRNYNKCCHASRVEKFVGDVQVAYDAIYIWCIMFLTSIRWTIMFSAFCFRFLVFLFLFEGKFRFRFSLVYLVGNKLNEILKCINHLPHTHKQMPWIFLNYIIKRKLIQS